MDIEKAKNILSGAILVKQQEMDAINLAINVLSNNFQAEFETRDRVVKELNDTYTTISEHETAITALEQEKVSLESVVADKDAVILSKETEIEAILADKSEVEAALLEKETIITELQKSVEVPVEAPVEPLQEEII